MRSIPRKQSGGFDWGALPDGRYFIEWYEEGRRRRAVAGITTAQALEAHRKKRHELEGRQLGIAPEQPAEERPAERKLRDLVDHYLDQVEMLKKRNTHCKYEAVLNRFAEHFPNRTLESVQTEELNDFVIALMRKGMSANTVLHNVIIVAQFFRRFGRSGLTRELQLPQRISTVPREYTEEHLCAFFAACDADERALFSTFLLTGMREQEVQYLFWTVQHWMGHKSLETTMRYLVPASDVRARLDQVAVPIEAATSSDESGAREKRHRRKPRLLSPGS